MHNNSEQAYEADFAKYVGYAVSVLAYIRDGNVTVQSCLKKVIPPIKLKQIEFLFDSKGRPTAYISWAFLTDEVINSIHMYNYELDISDWNEGDRLWVVDFVAPRGDAARLIRKVRTNHFPSGRPVYGRREFKNRPGHRIIHLEPAQPRVAVGL